MSISGHSAIVAIRATTGRFSLSATARALRLFNRNVGIAEPFHGLLSFMRFSRSDALWFHSSCVPGMPRSSCSQHTPVRSLVFGRLEPDQAPDAERPIPRIFDSAGHALPWSSTLLIPTQSRITMRERSPIDVARRRSTIAERLDNLFEQMPKLVPARRTPCG